MSRYLIPHGFGRDFWDLWDYPERLVDQNFGLPLDALVEAATIPSLYLRGPPARQRALRRKDDESGYSAVKNDDGQFQVKMDCSHFSPGDLEVKVVDGFLVVSGKHEEVKDEHGFISRQFTRRYALPKDVELEKITSSLNTNGVLTLTAPKKQPEAIKGKERTIPITMAANEASTGSGDNAGKVERIEA